MIFCISISNSCWESVLKHLHMDFIILYSQIYDWGLASLDSVWRLCFSNFSLWYQFIVITALGSSSWSSCWSIVQGGMHTDIGGMLSISDKKCFSIRVTLVSSYWLIIAKPNSTLARLQSWPVKNQLEQSLNPQGDFFLITLSIKSILRQSPYLQYISLIDSVTSIIRFKLPYLLRSVIMLQPCCLNFRQIQGQFWNIHKFYYISCLRVPYDRFGSSSWTSYWIWFRSVSMGKLENTYLSCCLIRGSFPTKRFISYRQTGSQFVNKLAIQSRNRTTGYPFTISDSKKSFRKSSYSYLDQSILFYSSKS